MFKTSGRASFLIILLQFLQYYVFVVLSGDDFVLFSPALLLRLLHQRRHLHTNIVSEYDLLITFFALKDRLAIIWRLLCLMAQILLQTFLAGAK